MCSYRQQGRYAFIFGLGLTVSCFFPERFIITVIAILIIILALALIRL